MTIGLVRRWHRAKWQRNNESRAFAFAGGFGVDSAAVLLDEVAHDRQSQPKAAVLSRCRSIPLAEPIKDEGQEFRIDSFTGVADRDFSMAVDAPKAGGEGPAAGSEFDGVGDEIPDHL